MYECQLQVVYCFINYQLADTGPVCLRCKIGKEIKIERKMGIGLKISLPLWPPLFTVLSQSVFPGN